MADFGIFIKRPAQVEAYHYNNYRSFMTDFNNNELPKWLHQAYLDKHIRLKDPDATEKVMILASKDGDHVIKNKVWIVKFPNNIIQLYDSNDFEQDYIRLRV